MTLPNKITLARIFLIPCFITMAIYYGRSLQTGDPQQWQRWTAIVIFVVAAASDGLDGYIARRYNQRSKLGVILDPIADKGLLFAGVVTLSVCDWGYEFPVWFPVLVIARDVVVVVGAVILHMLNGVVHIRPRWIGKWATALQMAALVMVMLQISLFTHTFTLFGHAHSIQFLDLSVWLAGLFTALSGIDLIVDGIAQLHDRGHGEAGWVGGVKEKKRAEDEAI